MTDSQDILVQSEKIDRVMRLTLHAPPANTYSHAMMRQLDDAILNARFDDEIEVIILTQLIAGLDPVHHRHHDIEQDQIGYLVACDANSIFSIQSAQCIETCLVQIIL